MRLPAVIAGCLLLSGCAAGPEPGSWAHMRQEARWEFIRKCTRAAHHEYVEEIMAGFYSAGEISQACHRLAREQGL